MLGFRMLDVRRKTPALLDESISQLNHQSNPHRCRNPSGSYRISPQRSSEACLARGALGPKLHHRSGRTGSPSHPTIHRLYPV